MKALSKEALEIVRDALLENLNGTVGIAKDRSGRVSNEGNGRVGGKWASSTTRFSGSSSGTVETPDGPVTYEGDVEGTVCVSYDESTGCGSACCPDCEEDYSWSLSVTCAAEECDTEPLEKLLYEVEDILEHVKRGPGRN